MKKILSLSLTMALMAAVFTGCGCEANVSTHPGGMITEESTRPSIMPHPTATHETTRPTETTRPQATLPTATGSDPTDENAMPNNGGSNGNAGSSNSSSPTDTTTEQRGRNRHTAR